MWNKVLKKTWLQITDYFTIWATTTIETEEDLKNAEEFINNTGIVNSLCMIKNRLFWEKIQRNAVNVISWSENLIIESWYRWERKELPTKIAVNLIENASLEDWKKLQDIWSRMLANAVTWKIEIKNSYIDILKQLTEWEVLFLNFIFNWFEDIKASGQPFDHKNQWFIKSAIISSLSLSESDFEVIVDNLVRLNLIHTWEWDWEIAKDASYKSLHMKRWIILLTCLWYEFIKACKF